MAAGRKKHQGSSSAAAAEKESGKGKGKGKEKEVREAAGKEAAKEKQRQKGKEKEVREAVGKEAAKDKQKQKGKQSQVREDDGKAKEKEKTAAKQGKQAAAAAAVAKVKQEVAAAEKSAGQQFFKIFFPDQSGQRLKIPAAFHQHLKEQPKGPVSLKGPSGNTWQAVLASDSEGLFFEQGWKEFVTDHFVKQGHFLVFTYDGLSRFSVTVFGSFGVVDPASLVAKRTNNVVIKIEDDDDEEEEEEEEEVHVDMDVGGTPETSVLPPVEGNGITGKRTREVNDVIADGNASKRHSSVPKQAEKRRPEAIAGTSKDASTIVNTEKVNDVIADGNASKRHSSVPKQAEKKRPEAIAGTSKDASTIVNTEKDIPFSMLNESMAFNKTQVRDKNMPKNGKFIVKRTRQPVVISQRRPVTEEEKDLALRRAKQFKSKNPFAVQTMMESYVYVGFFMNIACEFVRESLPRTSRQMTLWDPLGKPWQVNYVYYSERSVASFSGGWGKFALGNNLEKFDVCIFELFKEDNIKVHIYRVVPEITPLLRASSKD